MAQKKTIAIIGATTPVGTLIAQSIAVNFRLLLVDTNPALLDLLQDEIQGVAKAAELDILYCCKNASWEADIIVVANVGEDLDGIAATMKEVSNCKTVVHFTSNQNDIDKLQQLLPHAEVVTIVGSHPFTDATKDAFIRGRNDEATNTAKTIVAAMACHVTIP
jgi:hypothetical protein